jgi:hypothetical protein
MNKNGDIRELTPDDIGPLVTLLNESFPRHNLQFWKAAVQRLAARAQVPETPLLGYGLHDHGLKGAVLTISRTDVTAANAQVLTNISSWCVSPSHRGPRAKELYGCASNGHHRVIYSNLSAARHTIKTITGFGFSPWAAGQFIGVGTGISKTKAKAVTLQTAVTSGITGELATKLADHEALGCVVICIALADRIAPFIFLRRKIGRLLPCAQLIYCENFNDFTENSALINCALLVKGLPAMLVDASAPVAGMRGRYYHDKAAKYYKGGVPEMAVDHCYSEMVYIGF